MAEVSVSLSVWVCEVFFFSPPTAESFGVSAQIGSGAAPR